MNDTALNTESLGAALRAGGTLAADYNAAWDAFWRQTHLPVEVLELCRLRLAQLHRADAELALRHAPAEPAKIAALLNGDGAALADGERAALEFTEIYAQDPAAIDDATADAVKRHFGEAGLVCLVEALGFIDGRIRLALMFSALNNRAH